MKKFLLAMAWAAMVAMVAGSALANPPGLRDGVVGKKLAQFNVILKPNEWNGGGNACDGSRIFFWNDNGNTMGTITWFLGPLPVSNFTITDCDGTDGAAAVQLPDGLGDSIVAIRVMGPSGSDLKFVCTVVTANESTGEDLCVLDNPVDLSKKKNFTTVMMNLADGAFQNVLWDQFNNTWKIFQVRVYEWIH